MELAVNQSRKTGASGLQKSKATLKTIKTSSLLDNAVAMVSKDGRENVVQASGTIRASLMSVAAFMFCSEQGVNQIEMEETSTTANRIVQRENDHSFVSLWGMKSPSVAVHDRDGVFLYIFQKLETGHCIISAESTKHDQAPPREGVVRFYAKRLMRFSPLTPTTTRFTVTTVFDLGGHIPRFISSSVTTPAAARSPLSALRYFNQIKPWESFETDDAKELGRLLVLDTDDVRGKKARRPLEAKLRKIVGRNAVLRVVRGTFPWFEPLLVHVLRNRLGVPKGTKKALAEFGEEEGRKAGRGFANALIASASAEAAVDDWMKTYPAMGELEQR
jgi:hypothetical protein